MFMFGSLLSFLHKKCQLDIDNFIFWLHYRATALILAASALLVTSGQFFGDPIACGPAPVNLPIDVLNLYCWTRSTYSLREIDDRNRNPYETVYHGLGTDAKTKQAVHHSYYQWVWIVLAFQAAAFYLPRFLWKRLEGGRVARIVLNITDIKQDELKNNVNKWTRPIRLLWHRLNLWTLGYFGCELLCFANVVGQVYVIDLFLGGAFLTYGTDVLWYSYQEQESRDDPMVKVFPRLTKCNFRSFGASGSVQMHDALCVLPLNIVNEKVYVVLWFWLVLLAVPTGLLVLYRLLLVAIRPLRYWVFKLRFPHVSPETFKPLLERANLGDWFLLSLIGANLPEHYFSLVLVELDETTIKRQNAI